MNYQKGKKYRVLGPKDGYCFEAKVGDIIECTRGGAEKAGFSDATFSPRLGYYGPCLGNVLKLEEVREAKQLIYVAHPVSGAPYDNVMRTVAWINWFTHNDPTRIYIAPWIGEVLAFPGAKRPDGTIEPNYRPWTDALNDDEQVVSRFDGIILVGGRITEGMQRELDCAKRGMKWVTDMSRYALPSDLPEGFELDPAY